MTLPRAVARAHRISPGEDISFVDVGGTIQLRRESDADKRSDTERLGDALECFDAATERQRERNRKWTGHSFDANRGWTRDELYVRGAE